MTVDQLSLDVEAVAPIVAVVRQLHELPGSTWRDIFATPPANPQEGHKMTLQMSPDPVSVERA